MRARLKLYPIRTLPQVGNYVEQFDLHGNYLGEWPGWYNWPDEMVGDTANIIQHIKTQRLHVFKTLVQGDGP